MSKIKDIQIQLQPFTISSLTKGKVARCKIGIVEIQLLRAVDLVIYYKTRWIESVKIKAKQRAQTSVLVNDKLVSVKLNRENWIELPDLRLFDSNIDEIQKALQKQTTILYRLIYRYGLERVLLPNDKLPHDKLPKDKLPHDKLPKDKLSGDKLPKDKLSGDKLPKDKLSGDNTLDWKSVSFPDLKTDLLAFMNSQKSPMQFHFFEYPRHRKESICTPVTNSSSLFSKLEKLQAIFAAYSIKSTNLTPTLTSPFTPLVHYNGTVKRR